MNQLVKPSVCFKWAWRVYLTKKRKKQQQHWDQGLIFKSNLAKKAGQKLDRRLESLEEDCASPPSSQAFSHLCLKLEGWSVKGVHGDSGVVRGSFRSHMSCCSYAWTDGPLRSHLGSASALWINYGFTVLSKDWFRETVHSNRNTMCKFTFSVSKHCKTLT